jgi:small subunit ribosomal protein S4
VQELKRKVKNKMKRKHKKYSKPKRPFDKERIDEEAGIKKKFGLKNKKEIWRAEAKIKSIRKKAKKLISAKKEEQQALFDKLKKIGLDVNSIADVLSLNKTNFLERRLQTVVVNKKLSTTTKSARQLITHKKVLIDGSVIDSPSYIVPINLEKKITVKKQKAKPAPLKVSQSPELEDKKPKTEATEEVVEEKQEVKETVKKEDKK